ncbi:MAG: DNA-binding protein [Actinobacteria bacterium]|nr:DNA-binding protein [Actinomycetota bacterium]
MVRFAEFYALDPAQTTPIQPHRSYFRIGNDMPSKASGSPKGKATTPARPAVTKSKAKASAAKAKASGKSAPPVAPAAPAAASAKGKVGPKAAVKAKKAPAKAAATPTPAKPAAKATAPAKAALTRRPAAAAAAAKTPPAKDAVKVVKKGNYDKDSLGTIRKRLMEQREELQNQLTAIEESATGLSQSEMSGEVSYDEDFADAGSFTFEREKEFSIANNVTDLRSKTDRALHRIEEGSYGTCESCGQPIESARLKALPHVTLCLKCKKAEERR